jgi:hypothetical protein
MRFTRRAKSQELMAKSRVLVAGLSGVSPPTPLSEESELNISENEANCKQKMWRKQLTLNQ